MQCPYSKGPGTTLSHREEPNTKDIITADNGSTSYATVLEISTSSTRQGGHGLETKRKMSAAAEFPQPDHRDMEEFWDESCFWGSEMDEKILKESVNGFSEGDNFVGI